MKKEIPDCACQNPNNPQHENIIEDFGKLRKQCAVLKEVMVPDSIWTKFQKWDSKGRDQAAHRSILQLSFERGCINKITSPIHRYFFKNGKLSSIVSNNYL